MKPEKKMTTTGDNARHIERSHKCPDCGERRFCSRDECTEYKRQCDGCAEKQRESGIHYRVSLHVELVDGDGVAQLVHHINGDVYDNRIENLRLIAPGADNVFFARELGAFLTEREAVRFATKVYRAAKGIGR